MSQETTTGFQHSQWFIQNGFKELPLFVLRFSSQWNFGQIAENEIELTAISFEFVQFNQTVVENNLRQKNKSIN